MATPAIVGSAKGFPAFYGQHIQNAWSNNQGDKVVISPSAGSTLVAVVFGLKSYNPFDLIHGSSADPGFFPGLNDFAAAPTVADNSGSKTATVTAFAIVTDVLTVTANNQFQVGDSVTLSGFGTSTYLNGQTVTVLTASATQFTANFTHADDAQTEAGLATDLATGNNWAAAAGTVVNGGSDYTASLGDFTRSSKWALDGKYPSIYIFYALNVAAGTYTVTANSVYQDGTTRPQDLAAGKPIFDGGVDIHVFEFSGVALAAATDGSTGQMSAANPAVAPTFTTTTAGDLILTAGLMKSGNAFSTYAPAGTTGTVMLAAGKCVNSQAHWAIQMQLQTANGAIAPGFTNPLGYEMAVAAVALKHS